MVSGNQFSCPQHSLSLFFYLPLIGNFPESFLCWILPIFRERERQTKTMFFSNFRKNNFFLHQNLTKFGVITILSKSQFCITFKLQKISRKGGGNQWPVLGLRISSKVKQIWYNCSSRFQNIEQKFKCFYFFKKPSFLKLRKMLKINFVIFHKSIKLLFRMLIYCKLHSCSLGSLLSLENKNKIKKLGKSQIIGFVKMCVFPIRLRK